MKKLTQPMWKALLKDEFKKKYFLELKSFINEERKSKTILPKNKDVFKALDEVDFLEVKVVILGQDPYHGEGQAHGLSFSVKPGIKIPPSLRNIYKELQSDLGLVPADNGFLENWSKQGVLLLNNCLTVEMSKAGSHQKKGWELFTDKIIELLNEEREGLIFILWGGPAQKKAKKVSTEKHHVLIAPHPSPLSSYRGFFGCKHFSKTNEILRAQGKREIDWSIKNLDKQK